jgi:hypothetical protein
MLTFMRLPEWIGWSWNGAFCAAVQSQRDMLQSAPGVHAKSALQTLVFREIFLLDRWKRWQ